MCTGPHDFIPAPDTAKMELRYTLIGERALSVFYFQRAGGYTDLDLAALAASAENFWTSEIRPTQSGGTLLREIVVTDVSVENGQQVSNSTNLAGTASGNAMPNNITLAVSFRTGFSGRSFRGRVYHPGAVEEQIVANEFVELAADSIREAYANFFFGILGDTLDQHVIVSYCADNEWRTTAVVTPVTSYIITDTVVDSARRRLPGRGE